MQVEIQLKKKYKTFCFSADSGYGSDVISYDSHYQDESHGYWKSNLTWKEELKQELQIIKQDVCKKTLDEVKVPVWKEVKIPFEKEIKVPDWKIIRTPIWKEVKVPAWKVVKIPDWKTIKVPVWVEKKIPVYKEVKVPVWKKSFVPELVKEHLPGSKKLGKDHHGWEYVAHDVSKKMLVWKPVWNKVWKTEKKQEWLIEKKQLLVEKKIQVWKTEKKQEWITEKRQEWKEEKTQVWKTEKKEEWITEKKLEYKTEWKEKNVCAVEDVQVPVWKKVYKPVWRKIWVEDDHGHSQDNQEQGGGYDDYSGGVQSAGDDGYGYRKK